MGGRVWLVIWDSAPYLNVENAVDHIPGFI